MENDKNKVKKAAVYMAKSVVFLPTIEKLASGVSRSIKNTKDLLDQASKRGGQFSTFEEMLDHRLLNELIYKLSIEAKRKNVDLEAALTNQGHPLYAHFDKLTQSLSAELVENIDAEIASLAVARKRLAFYSAIIALVIAVTSIIWFIFDSWVSIFPLFTAPLFYAIGLRFAVQSEMCRSRKMVSGKAFIAEHGYFGWIL